MDGSGVERLSVVRMTPSWRGFLAWVGVGMGLGLGMVSILSIGLIVLSLTVVAVILVAQWRPVAAEVCGIAAGLGALMLLLAYANREGPGEVCTRTATGGSCDEQWNPWPFLAVGVLLTVGGVAAFLALRTRTRDTSDSRPLIDRGT